MKHTYTLTITRSIRRTISTEVCTFYSPQDVADYITIYIDHPETQSMLAEVEYHELDEEKGTFLPTAEDIDVACEAGYDDTAVVFEAGEEVESASLYGLAFMVKRNTVK